MELYKRLQLFFQTEPYAIESKAELKALLFRVGSWLILCEIALIAQLYPGRWFVDGFASGPSYDRLLPTAVMIGVIYIFGSLMHNRMDFWRNNFNQRLFAMWWSAGHRKELELSTAWHVEHGTGEKEALIQKNINRIEMTADYLLFEAVPILVRIFFTSLAMLLVCWQFGLLALLTFIAFALIAYVNYPALKDMAHEYHVEHKRLEEYGSNLTQNWQAIRAFGQELHFSESNKALLLKFWEEENPRHINWRKRMIINEHLISLSRGCLYALAAYIGINYFSWFTVGLLALSVAWMERVYSNYYRLNDCVRQLHRGHQALTELLSIFETKTEIPKPVNPQWPKSLKGQIELRNVSFAYQNGNGDALSKVNLTIRPNEVIAIIGPSGSGKTTLAKLLDLSYHPTIGDIFVDGINLKDMDPERYRQEMIGVVTQHPQLFDHSIAENIRLGKLTATIDEVKAAAQAAHACCFIEESPQGFDTLVGENGVRLSGGQKQRLTIARALVRNPKILILDEATSALDCESQLMVQRAIDERIASKSCTTIIIAHRFSTIESADRVIALDKGRVVEVGTHAELARHNGIYARFKQLETEGYLR